MKLALRLLALLLGLSLLGVIAASIAVQRLLPPEKVRSLVVEKASEALAREVRLDEASIGLFHGLTLKGLEVSEKPDFSAGVLARADSFSLKVLWRPLLRKRIVVDRLALDGLRLRLRKAKSGSLNLSGAAPPAASAEKAPSEPPPFEILARRATLAEGSVEFVDEASGSSWTISGIEARVEDFSLKEPFKARLKLRARGAFQVQAAFEGTIDLAGPDPDKMFVRIDRLDLESSGCKARVSGSVKGAASADMDLEAALSGALPPSRAQARLRLEGGDAVLNSLRIEGKLGSIEASGRLRNFQSAPYPDLKASLDLDLPAFTSADASFIPGFPPGLSVPAAKITGAISGTPDRAQARGLRIRIGGNDLQADGSVSRPNSEGGDLDLVLKCRSFVLEELTRISEKTRELNLSGSGLFALAFKGPASKPAMAGRLLFRGLGAEAAGLKLSGFSAVAEFDEKRISLRGLKGRVADGELAADLTVRDYLSTPSIDLEARLTRFALDKYLSAKAAAAAPSPAKGSEADAPKRSPPFNAKGKFIIDRLTHSRLSAQDTALTWDLKGISPSMRTLSGWARLRVNGGRLENLGQAASESVVVKVLVLPLMVIQKIGKAAGARIFPDFDKILFQEISGDYAFDAGKMTLRDSRLLSEAADVVATGTIDLPAEALDILVTAQIGSVAPVEIEVRGTFASPKVKARIGKFLADPAKKLFQRILKR